MYYQFVSRDLTSNTVESYKSIGDVVNDGRLAGLIDWDAIEDRTRICEAARIGPARDPLFVPAPISSPWTYGTGKRATVECWIEKDALVGVIEGICTELDVPYFACRGYTSQSEMWGAAQRLMEREKAGKKTFIIHLGDHDPSGIDMTRDIQDRLELFGSTAVIHRIALNFDQVEITARRRTRPRQRTPAMKATGAIHGEESWELDALEPRTIVDLIRSEIEVHIDQDAWEEALSRQQTGRNQLGKVSQRWNNVVEYLGNGDGK